jgi:hypothetical protein
MKETADWSAIVVLGVWSRRREEISRASPWMSDRWGTVEPDPAEDERLAEGQEQPRVIVAEAWRTRAALNDTTPHPVTGKPQGLVPRLLDTCRRRQANRILLENANRAKDVADEIRRQMYGHEFDVELVNTTGDKLSRMHSVSPLFNNGLVYGPSNLIRTVDRFGREQVDVREFMWFAEVMNECVRTPRGKQDLADATSQGLAWLRTNGFLELQPEFVKRQIEERAWKPKPGAIGRDIAKQYGVA